MTNTNFVLILSTVLCFISIVIFFLLQFKIRKSTYLGIKLATVALFLVSTGGIFGAVGMIDFGARIGFLGFAFFVVGAIIHFHKMFNE
jgi:hypothetical protein